MRDVLERDILSALTVFFAHNDTKEEVNKNIESLARSISASMVMSFDYYADLIKEQEERNK